MIIVDRQDNKFFYTVLDHNNNKHLETWDRRAAIDLDIKLNPSRGVEFVTKNNFTGTVISS
jgi:hypothetical protein